MPSFRFVHISDLHLARRPRRADLLAAAGQLRDPSVLIGHWPGWFSSYMPSALRAAAAHIYRNRTQLHATVITGDLATAGYRADDLQLARALVNAGGGGARYYVPHPLKPGESFVSVAHAAHTRWIPGNHDRYRDALFNAGGRMFDGTVGWPAGAAVDSVTIGTGLRVVGIDCALSQTSAHARFPDRLGVGEVVPTTLAQAQAASTRENASDILIWLVHWPPEFPNGSALMALRGETGLLHLAASMGVDMILSGHTHAPVVYVTSQNVPVACCGTTSQSLSGTSPHALFDVEVHRAGALFSANVREFHFDRDRVEFVPAARWQVTRNAQGAVAVARRQP